MAHKVGRKIRKAITSPFKRRRPTPKPRPRPKPKPKIRPRPIPKPSKKRAGERLVLTNCRIVKRKPTKDKVWERLGLDISKHPEIKRYRIQWFSGTWSKWYMPGKDDIDWKGSDRRVWSYFTDHNHEFEQCTVSYDRPEISVTVDPSSAEVGDKLNIEWDGQPAKEMVEVSLYRVSGEPVPVKKGSFPKRPPRSKPKLKLRPKPKKRRPPKRRVRPRIKLRGKQIWGSGRRRKPVPGYRGSRSSKTRRSTRRSIGRPTSRSLGFGRSGRRR